MGRDWIPLPIIIFYYGDRSGKLCLTIDKKLITMGLIHGMMANISVSGPKIRFHIENMGRDWVSLPIIFFYYGDRSGKLCLTIDKKLITMGPINGMMANLSVISQYLLLRYCFIQSTSGEIGVPLSIIFFYYGDRSGKLCVLL